jgi:hypothetical protein
MERVRIATTIFCVLLLVQIVRAVRREHIRVEISMGWFAATVLLLALGISDTALAWVSRLLGVQDASFVLLLVAGLLFLFTFFRFSVEVSSLKDHNIVLAQKLGLLEWEVKRQASEIIGLKRKKETESSEASSEDDA